MHCKVPEMTRKSHKRRRKFNRNQDLPASWWLWSNHNLLAGFLLQQVIMWMLESPSAAQGEGDTLNMLTHLRRLPHCTELQKVNEQRHWVQCDIQKRRINYSLQSQSRTGCYKMFKDVCMWLDLLIILLCFRGLTPILSHHSRENLANCVQMCQF